ncbi:hypothetical protein QZH41_017728, partial [Actinostola sp. cb2023]
KGIIERLDAGEVIIGDGGFSYGLEKRGYVKAGQWTPECVVENPEAVLQLHRDFLRAGADVMQAFTFSMQDDPVEGDGKLISWDDINEAACKLAVEVTKESPYAISSGSLCETGTAFRSGKVPKDEIQQKFKKQVDIFVKNDVDFIIAEYISHVQEAEWMVEVMKASGKPTAVTMAISALGDRHGIPPAECAVRLARAVGLDCGTPGTAGWDCGTGLRDGSAGWDCGTGLRDGTAGWNCGTGLRDGTAGRDCKEYRKGRGRDLDKLYLTFKLFMNTQMRADIIGVNCRFDPERSLETIQLMQDAIKKEGVKVHIMVQPVGYWTTDAGALGFIDLDECPLALEPRALTRWDCHRFARKAYDMGISCPWLLILSLRPATATYRVLSVGLRVGDCYLSGPFGGSSGRRLLPIGSFRLIQGADIIGVNCRFDPERSLETIQLMQDAIKKEGVKVHIMVQPVGYWTTDAGPFGFNDLDECPFALEPRALTRWDCHRFARKAYDMGIRYIGGCCGFEPYHIRALAEELSPERGRLPKASEKHSLWGEALKLHSEPKMRANTSPLSTPSSSSSSSSPSYIITIIIITIITTIITTTIIIITTIITITTIIITITTIIITTTTIIIIIITTTTITTTIITITTIIIITIIIITTTTINIITTIDQHQHPHH